MAQIVSDIRANLNENLTHAAKIIGRSKDRRAVYDAIYFGKKRIKTVSDIVNATGLKRIRVLQEGRKLSGNNLVEQTKKDGDTAYKKYDLFSHHKDQINALLNNPQKRLPTKQRPNISTNTVKIVIKGNKPKTRKITVDEIDSFKEVKNFRSIDNSIKLDNTPEITLKKGFQKILKENHEFKDWGGEKNDLYTSKVLYKGKRRTAAFALKGRATKGNLTPKKMGKNGDQISRLFSSSADMFFVAYHSKVDESILSQMEAFAIGKSLSGNTIYICIIDGEDLNRLCQAYRTCFSI